MIIIKHVILCGLLPLYFIVYHNFGINNATTEECIYTYQFMIKLTCLSGFSLYIEIPAYAKVQINEQ